MKSRNVVTTVFGSGFIGSAIGECLKNSGKSVQIISRNNWPNAGSDLGNVIFTSGMTAGFRDNPIETAEVHVCYLANAIKIFDFNSFVYLSSTRLYINEPVAIEDCRISVDVSSSDSIFTSTKLAAEALLMSLNRSRICIARISNVYGGNDKSNNFLTSLIEDFKKEKNIIIRNSRNSEKDYIHIDDVVRYVVEISNSVGRNYNIYNVASGINITNSEIAKIFRNNGSNVSFSNEENLIKFPAISTNRLVKEYGETQSDFSENLLNLIEK